MSCCPKESWGPIKAGGPETDYVNKGVVENVGEMEVYRVGDSTKCIVWNYHIMGFNGGRARQLVDMIASKGFMVVMPDYFRGGFCEPTKPEFNEFLKRVTVASNITKDFDAAMKYAKEHGAQTFSCIGTCWGSYANLRISGHMKSLKCAVSLHPAHHGMIEALGEDENAILEEAKGVPQMFLPAGNDPPETKEGGLARKILGEGESCLKIVEFHDMVHGWTVRGDMSVPEVDRDIRSALDLTIDFVKTNMNA